MKYGVVTFLAAACALLFSCAPRRGTVERPPVSPVPQPPGRLSREVLDESLKLGRRFLLNSQRPAGNFFYRYDFLRREDSSQDSSVRQAGALWGLALVHQHSPSPETAEAVRRGLEFFDGHSRLLPGGAKYVIYPGDANGSTGTVALVCLTLAEMMRTDLSLNVRARYRLELDAYLDFLLSLRTWNGRFRAHYDHRSGAGMGPPSPYYDGESLLAMVKAARYAGKADLWDVVEDSAEIMHQAYVVEALKNHPDSELTKAFFQWAILAYFEMYASDRLAQPLRAAHRERLAARVLDMAYWMIEMHRTLRRKRNTGYAHEGLVSVWELARRERDQARALIDSAADKRTVSERERPRMERCEAAMERIGAVIDEGLARLTCWQVGGPTPNAFLRAHPTTDPRAIGGVMNGDDDPRLRIDVTQHQMHAVILARRYIYR